MQSARYAQTAADEPKSDARNNAKLLTELVNTPLGRQGAVDPGAYAAALVTALANGTEDAGLGLRKLGA